MHSKNRQAEETDCRDRQTDSRYMGDRKRDRQTEQTDTADKQCRANRASYQLNYALQMHSQSQFQFQSLLEFAYPLAISGRHGVFCAYANAAGNYMCLAEISRKLSYANLSKQSKRFKLLHY